MSRPQGIVKNRNIEKEGIGRNIKRLYAYPKET